MRPGCYITVLEAGWASRRGAVQVLKSLDDKRFFFFFSPSYGGNSLLMNAGSVCSAAHQNPEATRHFSTYVTAAHQQSGNNGGNNLDLCLKSIRGTFRRIPLSVIFSCSSPSTPQRENVVVFKHADIRYLIEIPIVTKHHFCSSGMGKER